MVSVAIMEVMVHPYEGREASLATQHEKWGLIAPVMRTVLSMDVVNVEVDTDVLGTFSGEVPRRGTPVETAIAKARMGMEASGLSFGLANEGSIGPHPYIPFVVSDMEVVVLVDDELGIVVIESEIEIAIPSFSVEVHPSECAELSLESAGFPDHGLMVLPLLGSAPIVKGIHDRDELIHAAWHCLDESGAPMVRVQSDLRAHHHPTRRLVIERAAHRLANRLATLCPTCSSPGWGLVRHETGCPCSECSTPTYQCQYEVFGCVACEHEQLRDVGPIGGVDPVHCPRCNP